MERVISGLDQILHPIEKKKNPFWTNTKPWWIILSREFGLIFIEIKKSQKIIMSNDIYTQATLILG